MRGRSQRYAEMHGDVNHFRTELFQRRHVIALRGPGVGAPVVRVVVVVLDFCFGGVGAEAFFGQLDLFVDVVA